MADKIRYTFACLYPDEEECCNIAYWVPEDVEDPKAYFEDISGERVHAYWKAREKESDETI